MPEKIVLLGAGGQLGRQLQKSVPQDYRLHAFSSRELDIRDRPGLDRVLGDLAPTTVVNAAAYTHVDKAESKKLQANAVNAEGPEKLAAACPESCRIIHLSTDFVFDGLSERPYRPQDKPGPVNIYGASKLAGEKALMSIRPDSLIIRTSWLYGAEGNNFVNTMLRLMAEREELSVVDDQRGTPTSVRSLAEVIWRFLDGRHVSGIFHWTDRGEATWYDFACEIQRQALELGLLKKQIPIRAIKSHAFPTPARRPAYSVLDKSSTYEALGYKGRNWQEELRDVLAQKV